MKRWLIAGCALMLMSAMIRAQADVGVARFSATNQAPLVGEPVQLTLTAAFPSGMTMVEWPDFPDQWNVFEVRGVGELNIAEQNGALEYRQDITIVLWEPGDYSTPETLITYSGLDGTLAELYVTSLPITVPSVLTSDLDLRPLKPLVFLSYIPPALLVILMFTLSLVVVWLVQRRNKPRRLAVNWQGDIRELDRRMLAVLSNIDRQALEPGEVYAAAADCLRDYLMQQFQVATHELTTGELLAGIQPFLSQPLFNRLGQLMTQADLVKFARQIPNRESAQQYLETAARWIQAATSEAARPNERMGG